MRPFGLSSAGPRSVVPSLMDWKMVSSMAVQSFAINGLNWPPMNPIVFWSVLFVKYRYSNNAKLKDAQSSVPRLRLSGQLN
jgi:hypothetical protein